MSSSAISALVVTVMASGSAAALVTAWFSKRLTSAQADSSIADAVATIAPVWRTTIERLENDVTQLKTRVRFLEAANDAYLHALRANGIDVPPVPPATEGN